MSNVFALSIGGGATLGETDYANSRISYLGTGSLEYYFATKNKGLFGIKGYAGMGYIAGQSDNPLYPFGPTEIKTSVDFLGLGLSYTLSLNDKVYPYVSVGYSSLWYWPRNSGSNQFNDNTGNLAKSGQMGALNAELGIKFMISRVMSINLAGAYLGGAGDKVDGLVSGSHNDAAFTLTAGLSYYFGRNKDADKDGVPDYLDACPNTPIGVKVDAMGCPLDSDGDGVPDYLDKCPNTPAGVAVDKDGCPVDLDGDGVPDYLDKCPNTPAGVAVDNNGCPLDSDGDGVPDYLDKCPNTPAGVTVDSNGCPLDSDGDGVPDYLDKCPNTPQGTPVDVNGCPIVKVEPPEEHFILRGDANFKTGKANLLPGGKKTLDGMIPTMKKHPKMQWVVEGYTDAVGSDSQNLKLSERRAQIVIDYLISKGINKSYLTKKAFGKADPVGDNKTPEGRALNRRVEIKAVK
jgi:outer membrane protein OmpA-like peptidoglycan-associated protein